MPSTNATTAFAASLGVFTARGIPKVASSLPRPARFTTRATAGTVSHTPVKTDRAAAAVGPYNQGIVTRNRTLYISGCIGLLPGEGSGFAGPSMAEQTKQALSNMKEIVRAAGGDIGNIVKTTVLLKNIEDYAEFNEIYKEFLKDVDVFPARSAFAVKALPKDALVEVEAIAELP